MLEFACARDAILWAQCEPERAAVSSSAQLMTRPCAALGLRFLPRSDFSERTVASNLSSTAGATFRPDQIRHKRTSATRMIRMMPMPLPSCSN